MLKNKIIERTYIQIEGILASPLLAGSGESNNTDIDVLRDYYGTPFVAGTAIAGVFRHWLETNLPNSKIAVHSLFGAKKATNENMDLTDFRQSRIFISDTQFKNKDDNSTEKNFVMTRDHVKLTDKVADGTGKFDVEVIETGTLFTMQLEYIVRESSDASQDCSLIQTLVRAMDNGELTLGGKTNRGYGKLAKIKMRQISFDYSKQDDIQTWLDWSWDKIAEPTDNPFEDSTAVSAFVKVEVPLTIKQTLLIRDYKTIDELDYTYLRANGLPVIPGSTWAGAFRQRLQQIVTELEGSQQIVNTLFGSKHGEQYATPSILQFEESVVNGSSELVRTRNAIDRFSGATIDGALFTSESVCQGTTQLVIRWRKQGNDNSNITDDVIRGILHWLIYDLTEGLLAVGGETSVGRGVFELAGKVEPEIDNAQYRLAAIKWVKDEGFE